MEEFYNDDEETITASSTPFSRETSSSTAVEAEASSLFSPAEHALIEKQRATALEVLQKVTTKFISEHISIAQAEIASPYTATDDFSLPKNSGNSAESPWNVDSKSVQVIDLTHEDIEDYPVTKYFDDDDLLNYYSCTPGAQNIKERLHTNGPSFIPHADAEEMFPIEDFLRIGREDDETLPFEWEYLNDPDQDTINLEVIRILHSEHQLTLQEIQRTNLLTTIPVREDPQSGLLYLKISRKEFHDRWESRLSYRSRFLIRPDLPRRSILEDINASLHIFCPNGNCVISRCHIHSEYEEDIHQSRKIKRVTQHIEPRGPQKTSDGIFLKYTGENITCSDHCFLRYHGREDHALRMIPWSDEKIQELRELLEVVPDGLPCSLAVMCRKPCNEVYLYRQTIFPDHDITSRGLRFQDDLDHRRHPALLFEDSIRGSAKPRVTPCTHTGECGYNAPDCYCFTNKQYCQRLCRCPDDCAYRFKGCSCQHTHGESDFLCVDEDKCECINSGRECDPDLCRSCNARGSIASSQSIKEGQCNNVDVQREKPKAIEVKSSKHGLGAYAIKRIEPGSFIAEYIAEIQGDETIKRYEYIHDYRKLNYNYDYEEDQLRDYNTVLNSDTLGNETRYLNDARNKKKNNTIANIVLVNNDRRICLIASKTIPKGRELFLDYGKLYWQDWEKEKRNKSPSQ